MSELGVTPSPPAPDEAQQFRSQVGHISRHSGMFFAGTIFSVGFGYIFKVYLARVLGAEALGLYALGMTLVGFLGIFNTLGLPQSAVRFVAQYLAAGQHKQLHALLWRGAALLLVVNLVLAGVLLACGKWVAVHVYHSPALVQYLPWFAGILLFGVVTGFYGKVLAGFRDMKFRTLIVNFIGSPLNMLATVLLVSAGMGLRGYLAAQTLSGLIVGVLLVMAVRHFTPEAARFGARAGMFPERQVWTFSAAMLGVGLLEFVIAQVDKVTLGAYRGAREVGVYSVAGAMVVYVPLVLSSVNQIFTPTIADLHARGERAMLARLFQSLTKWVVGLTLPLAFVVIEFARPLMRIFGPDFEFGWPVLVIGTAAQLINCGVGSVGYLLLMSGNERRLIKVQSTMAVVTIVCSLALIPRWGVYGAAAAAAITNAGTNLWALIEVRRALRLSPYNRSYVHLIAPAAATLVLVFLCRRMLLGLPHQWMAIGITLVLAYLVFPSVFLLVSGLDADDRLIAAALRSRIRGVFERSGVRA